MVCLGNICRSPLAHGILASKLPYENFEVDSAGTSGYHDGELPDKRSVAIAKQNGLDITNQRSRKFTVADFDEFDIIYAMDQSNYHNIKKLGRDEKDLFKVRLILNEPYPNSDAEVPDPYYGGDQGFDNVYQMLDEACNVIEEQLLS